jgi:Tol biopolymer transport system component
VVVIASLSEKNVVNLWRFHMASGEFKQLTFEKDVDPSASCTPDGKWMVYLGKLATDNMAHIFKLAVDGGGAPVELARGNVGPPSISPDGSLVAFTRIDGQGASAKSKFIVQKLEGGAPVQEPEAPADILRLGWTPDGRALTYLHTVGSARHLYMQPLTGGPPIQLTHFTAEPSAIQSYAWSRDGKKVAITRARYADTDLVLFSGFR